MKSLERRAAETGRTVTSLVEEALRSMLDGNRPAPDYRFDWRIGKGGASSGIDLSDRDALMDLMHGRG
jgi:hypothetical protein